VASSVILSSVTFRIEDEFPLIRSVWVKLLYNPHNFSGTDIHAEFRFEDLLNASIMLINSSDGLYPRRQQSTFLFRNPSNELENRKVASMGRPRHRNKIHIVVLAIAAGSIDRLSNLPISITGMLEIECKPLGALLGIVTVCVAEVVEIRSSNSSQ
jgi:hypothetical protein